MLEYHFSWDSSRRSRPSLSLQVYKDSVKSAEVVEFLAALLRRIPGPLLIVWDRLSAHRSEVTRAFIAGQGERMCVEYVPGCAPELNPDEDI